MHLKPGLGSIHFGNSVTKIKILTQYKIVLSDKLSYQIKMFSLKLVYLYFINNCITLWVSFFILAAVKLLNLWSLFNIFVHFTGLHYYIFNFQWYHCIILPWFSFLLDSFTYLYFNVLVSFL